MKTKPVMQDKFCLATHGRADNAPVTSRLHFDYL